MRANQDIRLRAMEKGVLLWQIAEKLGIQDFSFSRRLRRELSPEAKEEAFKAIDTIVSERAKEGS